MLTYLTWYSHILILDIYSIYDKYLLSGYFVTDFILNGNQGFHLDLPVKWKRQTFNHQLQCTVVSTTMRVETIF